MKIIEHLHDILFFEQWALRFDLSSGMPGSMERFREIRPPRDRFWADPHVVFWENRYYIFIEEYVYKDKKAHISVIEMDIDGCYTQPVQVLDAAYHLSYPFVFEHDGELYMIPESCENHSIELYKAVQFPHRWELQMNLMNDVVAVDTTLYFKNNKWWLFTNMAKEEGKGTWRDLFLFSSDKLFTDDWFPHQKNPVVAGVGAARPAGALFEHQGKTYRPSQNSEERYGHGFNINELLRIDEQEYNEKMVVSIKPDWDPKVVATHTFSQANNLSVIDVQVRRSRWF
ncbi:MAG: hypothetical protein QNL62_13985 [Gammaproteobacteria bacterium]|nr:hypothetical protein [Gammaproteobacteria bacterium]